MPSILGAALALIASIGLADQSAAAEITLSGTGTFKPPSAEQLASLPAGLAFTRADLESGRWSFSVRYDDRPPDADPDPYSGRYVGAIRAFRVTVGSTTIELPVDQAALSVSDGGFGAPHRESIRVDASMPAPSGTLRASWIQINQRSHTDDLRGAAGVLETDAMPSPSTIAELATSSPFDRFFELRIDAQSASRPLLYLSSSKMSVAVEPAAVR